MIKMRDGLVKRFTSQPDAKSQFVDLCDEVCELLLESDGGNNSFNACKGSFV